MDSSRSKWRQQDQNGGGGGLACLIGSLLALILALSSAALLADRAEIQLCSRQAIDDGGPPGPQMMIQRMLHCEEDDWDQCQANLQKLINSCSGGFSNSPRSTSDNRQSSSSSSSEPISASGQTSEDTTATTPRLRDLRYAVSVAEQRLTTIIYPPLATTAYQERLALLTPILSEARPRTEWQNLYFPDVTIGGLPKAGSSQLSHILQSHPQATLLTTTSEYFFDYNTNLDETNFTDSERRQKQKALFRFFANNAPDAKHWFRPVNQLSGNKTTFSTCFFPDDNILRARYLKPTKSLRFVLLFRDPADWLWSAWNYFAESRLDVQAPSIPEATWVNASLHYRSPELFHELMAGNDRVQASAFFDYFRKMTVETPRKLIQAFGRDSVLMLHNQDLLPKSVANRGGLLDQLAQFTGLARDGFVNQVATSIHNCNDHKGNDASCDDKNKPSSAYAASGHRPMLPETRQLVYLYFAAECKIWKDEFGMDYPDCLNALPEAQRTIRGAGAAEP